MEIFQRLLDDQILIIFIVIMVIVFLKGFYDYKRAASIEDKLETSSRFPPLLVSLGMLGTFIGIFFALSNFNTASGQLRSAVDGFIGGMFTAFASSVFGLTLSLIFRIYLSFQDHKFSTHGEKEADVSDLLDKMTEVKDAISKDDDSSLLYQLKSMRTDMNDKLRELKDSFNTFQQEMAKNNIQALVEAVNEVMETFNAKINDKLGETFERLNSSVEKLVIWQDEYKGYLEQAKIRLEEAKNGIGQAQSNLEKIASSMESLPERAKSIEVIVDKLGNQINDLESRLEAFNTMKEKAINAMPLIEENIEKLTSGLEENIDKVSQQIIKTTDGLKTTVENSVDGLDSVSANIKDTITSTTSEIKNSVEQQKIHMEAITKSVSENIETSTSAITKNIQENLNSINSLGEEIKNTTNDAVKDLNDRMIEQVSAIDRNIQETHKRVIEEMGKRLTALSDHFVDDYTPLTNQLRELILISQKSRDNNK